MTMPEEDSPSDYAERVESVCREAADEFRTCVGDLLAQLHVCARYFQRGAKEGISHGELVDFLGADGRVLALAGYSDAEADRVMSGLVLLTEDEHGTVQAPATLPGPQQIPTAA